MSDPAPVVWSVKALPSTITFPVVAPPRFRVCIAVVDNVPVALRNAPPAAPAEIEAVGVPKLMFRTANLALVVDCPPIRRSTVELFGVRNPAPSVQLDELPAAHDPQAAVAPPLRQSE